MAISFRLELSPRAKSDSEAVHDEIAQDRPLTAAKWMRGFHAKLRYIKRFPFASEVIPEAFDLALTYRHAQFKSHRIIYSIEGRQIRVHRVIHAARLLHARMLEE
jgi:plasmid stabilization system protein ParE